MGTPKKRKLVEPKFATVVDPTEYEYFGDFAEAVHLANKNKVAYIPMDIGKVWGLVLAYQDVKRNSLLMFEMARQAIIAKDPDAVIRFRGNVIVADLLSSGVPDEMATEVGEHYIANQRRLLSVQTKN